MHMCKQATSTLHSGDFQCPLDPFPSINFATPVASHKVLEKGWYWNEELSVLDTSLAHGHQRSTICWEHRHLGQIPPAPAFVTTCPKHDTQRKLLPPCFFALLFSKDEVINHHRLGRLLLEQLAVQRTLQEAIGYTESWHFKVLFKKSFQYSYRLVMPKRSQEQEAAPLGLSNVFGCSTLASRLVSDIQK